VGDQDIDIGFLKCSNCGGKLIRRTKNLCGHFRYGRLKKPFKSGKPLVHDDNINSRVDMIIIGTVKMRCFRCGSINLFSFFPSATEE